MKKECLWCKKMFNIANWEKERKYCTHTCYSLSLKGKMPKSPPPHKPIVFIVCPTCNITIKRKRTKQICCSKKCAGIYSTSKVEKKSGICKNCNELFIRDKSYWGKMMFCSVKCNGKYKVKENSPSWKGGIKRDKDRRKSFEGEHWRKSVFERDNYTCQECGVRGGQLEAHHIKPYSKYIELRFELSNGQTLCKLCHKKTDSYGFRGLSTNNCKTTT